MLVVLLTGSQWECTRTTIRGTKNVLLVQFNEVYDFEITAKPLDVNEAYGDEFTTSKTVRIQTNVDSISCRLQSELFSEPDPVTIGVLGTVVVMFVYWFSRRGASVAVESVWDVDAASNLTEVSDISEISIDDVQVEEEVVPEPVIYEEDVELVE